MPANLTPDYLAAEEAFRRAKTPEEKLAAVRRMLATLPKHKGTEKIHADLRRRLARLNEEIQSQARKRGHSIHVEREGAGQVAVVGPPNSGKSTLVAALSGVAVPIGAHPYTTRAPVPAMMPYEDIRIQLVDLPPVSSEHAEGWVANLVRNADAALLVVDLSREDVLERAEDCLAVLEQKKVRLVGGEPAREAWAPVVEKRARLVGSKLDLPGARDRWEPVRDVYGEKLRPIAVSGATLEGVESLRQEIFRLLRVVRVYSKPPHKPPDRSRPFVLPEGSTVLELAEAIHRDLAGHLKFARIWGHGKFQGQRVTKDHVLTDGDIVELV
jgi:hypothetical protein